MEVNISVKRDYYAIDLFKFVMALFVIAIHTEPMTDMQPGNAADLLLNLFNLAVPFFFIESGFLLGHKLSSTCSDEHSIWEIRRYRNKILKMYLIWTVVYMPLAAAHYVLEGETIIRSVLLYIDGLFLLGEHYNSWILWYLLSTVYALIFAEILLRHGIEMKGVLAVGWVILFISYGIDKFTVMNNLSGIFEKLRLMLRYSIVNGRIFGGFFYIPFGIAMANRNFRKFKWMYASVFIFSLFILVQSQGFIKKLAVTASAIGLTGIVNNMQLPESSIWRWLRKSSVIVYFIHLYVWTFFYMVKYGKKTYGMEAFLVTAGVSIGISAIIIIYENTKSRMDKERIKRNYENCTGM